MENYNQLHREINVLIADEYPAFCRGLEEIIKRIPGVKRVDIATTGNEALELLSLYSYDLAMLDVKMPNISVIKAAYYTRRKSPDRNHPPLFQMLDPLLPPNA